MAPWAWQLCAGAKYAFYIWDTQLAQRFLYKRGGSCSCSGYTKKWFIHIPLILVQKLRACLFSRWSLFQRSSLVTNSATHHMLVELSCAVDRRMAYFAFYHWNSSWDHIWKRHFETLVNRLVSWWRSWKQRCEIRLGAHLKNKQKSSWPFIVQVYKSWRMYQSGIGLGKLIQWILRRAFSSVSNP